jgi:DNA-binding HxlR family transcriptional regulator
VLIVRELLTGTRRFDDLRRRLGIADNMLSARLKTMAAAGLVERRPYLDGRGTRHEYHPTTAADDMLPLLHAFALWADKHAFLGSDRRVAIVCRGCGAHSAEGERCSACGRGLDVRTTAWITPAAGVAIPLDTNRAD